MRLVLPWPPSILSPNSRAHWAKKLKSKQTYKLACYALALQCIPHLPQGNIPLDIMFHPPSKRGFDLDNALASVKAGLDGVAGAWKVNDKMFRPISIDMGEVIQGGKVIIAISSK